MLVRIKSYFLLLLLFGCEDTASVQEPRKTEFVKEFILSQYEMVDVSDIVRMGSQTACCSEDIKLEVISGKELIKLTEDKKVVALKDGEVQLKNKLNGSVYRLKIDSNDLSTAFLNLNFIDLYTGVALADDVLTVGHRYALGMSSRFPLKQGDVKLKPTNEELVQQDTVGNIFITPTRENKREGEELLVNIQVNGREYAKYFKIKEQKIEGSRLITDPQKRFLPVGVEFTPLVSYVGTDDKVRPVSAEILTYEVEGKELSLAELHDYLLDPKNLGQKQVLVKYPNLVEATLNYEIVTLGDFVKMFGIETNLPTFPEALQAHIDVPYHLVVKSNGIDVTSLVEFDVGSEKAARVDDGFLVVSNENEEVGSFLVSFSIDGDKPSAFIPNNSDYYKVNVDKSELRLKLDVADSLYTKGSKDLPTRLLLNDINVSGRNLGVTFINSTGGEISGSEGRKGWSTCSLSFSEPRSAVLFDDKIYGVPESQMYESLFTFDCRERSYINAYQAIDFVAISSMGVNGVVDHYGTPLLLHPEENGIYRIVYDKFNQQSVQVNVSPFLNDIFNHYSKNWLTGPYTVSGSEDLIVDSRGNLTFLGSFQPSLLTLQFQGEEQITYDIDVDYNSIEASDTHIYNQSHHSMTLAKNIELNGQQLPFEDIPYLKWGIPITVSAINEKGENTDITSHIRLKADRNTENAAIILSGNRLYMNTQGLGQYQFDLLDRDYRQELSSVLFNVVDTMKIHVIRGPVFDMAIPVGSNGRLAFKRKDGSDYEILLNRTTSYLRSYQYMRVMFKDIFSKSGGNILPVDVQTGIINTIGSFYRNGFGISDNLMVELEQPIQYDFEIIDPSGNLLFSWSK
ncbi:hypothetical protein VCRLGP8_910041 [Vibrio crassostreae]|nr:hypothetical protein VCRLGP8_910041 [Vibrio crassostreae]